LQPHFLDTFKDHTLFLISGFLGCLGLFTSNLVLNFSATNSSNFFYIYFFGLFASISNLFHLTYFFGLCASIFRTFFHLTFFFGLFRSNFSNPFLLTVCLRQILSFFASIIGLYFKKLLIIALSENLDSNFPTLTKGQDVSYAFSRKNRIFFESFRCIFQRYSVPIRWNEESFRAGLESNVFLVSSYAVY
jgi:hypothetical protein